MRESIPFLIFYNLFRIRVWSWVLRSVQKAVSFRIKYQTVFHLFLGDLMVNNLIHILVWYLVLTSGDRWLLCCSHWHEFSPTGLICSSSFLNLFIYLFIYLFSFFRAALMAYGSSQIRGWIRVAAAGYLHSHSNARSKQDLWAIPQLTAMLDP